MLTYSDDDLFAAFETLRAAMPKHEEKQIVAAFARFIQSEAEQAAASEAVERSEKAVIFAGLVLKEHRNDGYPGDVDGDFLQSAAVLAGLIEERRVESSCGSECSCADIGEFPTVCYFNTDAGKEAIEAANKGERG